MSEQLEVEHEFGLEELFRTREFGHPWNGVLVPGPEAALFSTPEVPWSPMPLDTSAMPVVAGHDSLTHRRHNRAFATVSGVAAALLIAVGLVAHSGPPTRSLGTAALGSHSSPRQGSQAGGLLPTDHSALPTGATPAASLSDDELSIGTAANGVRPGATLPGVPAVGEPGASGGTGGVPGGGVPAGSAPSVPIPANGSASVLTSVVKLVGSTVATVGITATSASSVLGSTLTPLVPVTDLVGSIGTTLSHLGAALGGSNT